MEKYKLKELNAVLSLQKTVRMYLAKKRFTLLKKVTLEIQRNLKGFFERQSFNKHKSNLNNQMNSEFYKYHVRKIQYQ
jgi:hypothetical protein